MNSLLTILAVFLPAAGALAIAAVPKGNEGIHKTLGIVVSAITVVVGALMLLRFDYSSSGPQFEVNVSWIPAINSRFHVFVDGISLPLLTLSMLITLLCMVYSAGHLPKPVNARAFLSLLLLLETGVNGAFMAQDLILFFLFFELVLVPMYFLIGVWGGDRRQYASLKFFVYTVLGSAFMLLAFLALYFLGDQTFSIQALSQADSPLRDLGHTTQLLIFAGLFVGFAIKVPMFPFHTWMPDAHTEAPTVASVILAAVMLKLGAYGFLRIAIPVLPDAAQSFAPWIGLLGVIAIIYGAIGCLAQHDLKRLIAFSSLSHMGFVMLGIATLTDIGLNAAIFAMVAHGLITGMLFFVTGSVQHRLHTREIAKLGGLLSSAPRLTWILGFCAMASLGIPGLAGFWGEFSTILASFQPADGLPVTTFRVYMVLAAVGTVLAAGYMLWMYSRVAFGKAGAAVEGNDIKDVTFWEWGTWAPLIFLILLFGVFPSLLFDVSQPSVQLLLERMQG